MVNIIYFCNLTSFILSILALLANIIVGFKRFHTLRVLPKAIRLFIIVCCLPSMSCMTFAAFYSASYYLIYNNLQHWSVDTLRTILSFGTQQIRNCFVFIVIERIYATIKLEKYSSHSEVKFFWCLTIISFIISSFFITPNIIGRFIPGMFVYVFELTNYFVFGIHIFLIFACIILHFLNKRMYKVSAYQMTLKRRYTIFENIKISTFLFPSILIYTFLVHGGALTGIICQTLNLPTMPFSIYHIFHSITFLFIYFRHYFMKEINQETSVKSNAVVVVVKNPFGKDLPASVSSEQYFKDLKLTWK